MSEGWGERELVLPSSWALSVTVIAPNHTTTNTAAKTSDAVCAGAVAARREDSSRHTSRGPQRSPGE